ncbi:MAG: hypothetical protein J6J13_03875 [Clostridia bacterium]|nr:hypothetical protein [Clostridia bacterium]
MPLVKEVKHIFEPMPLQCGQAVLAMLSGVAVDEIVLLCSNDRETTLKDMKETLTKLNISFENERVEVFKKEQLPEIALLSLETPRCWHWSLYFRGVFYDPEHGILQDFPPSKRKYYWKIKSN